MSALKNIISESKKTKKLAAAGARAAKKQANNKNGKIRRKLLDRAFDEAMAWEGTARGLYTIIQAAPKLIKSSRKTYTVMDKILKQAQKMDKSNSEVQILIKVCTEYRKYAYHTTQFLKNFD